MGMFPPDVLDTIREYAGLQAQYALAQTSNALAELVTDAHTNIPMCVGPYLDRSILWLRANGLLRLYTQDDLLIQAARWGQNTYAKQMDQTMISTTRITCCREALEHGHMDTFAVFYPRIAHHTLYESVLPHVITAGVEAVKIFKAEHRTEYLLADRALLLHAYDVLAWLRDNDIHPTPIVLMRHVAWCQARADKAARRHIGKLHGCLCKRLAKHCFITY